MTSWMVSALGYAIATSKNRTWANWKAERSAAEKVTCRHALGSPRRKHWPSHDVHTRWPGLRKIYLRFSQRAADYRDMAPQFKRLSKLRWPVAMGLLTIAALFTSSCEVVKVAEKIATIYARLLEDKLLIESLVRDIKSKRGPNAELRIAYVEASAAQRSYFEVVKTAAMLGEKNANLDDLSRTASDKAGDFVERAAKYLGMPDATSRDFTGVVRFPSKLHAELSRLRSADRSALIEKFGNNALWISWDDL